jgi:hypothetical protein
MPLALTDPRWSSLKGSYGGVADVLKWLDEAYASGMTSDLLGDLINEVQHQGDSSSAMYALAPHLVQLAQDADPEMKLSILTSAGLIYASAGKDGWADCEDFLEDEMREIAPAAASALASFLPATEEFVEFQWGVAALAGLLGHDSFARLLCNLDLFEGKFHHQLLDHPIPVYP